MVNEHTFALIQSGGMKKGDVLTVAQIAGVMGAKRTPDIIPMCHPILMDGINLVKILTEKGFDVTYTAIVPDEAEMIQSELLKCADEKKIALVLTTGGTGFSPRDITPEAAMEVIQRPTPGISEAMRAESMKITPKGCLSRSVAGIRARTLIITLPGSQKASAENILAVIDPVAHGWICSTASAVRTVQNERKSHFRTGNGIFYTSKRLHEIPHIFPDFSYQ